MCILYSALIFLEGRKEGREKGMKRERGEEAENITKKKTQGLYEGGTQHFTVP